MSTTKKVSAKKEVQSTDGCPTCGCCCKNSGIMGSLVMVMGGLVVALSFFLLQSML
ncbi:MAG: hypothetical protein V1664_00350 [Candidatus Uhrbacteria bacterium]